MSQTEHEKSPVLSQKKKKKKMSTLKVKGWDNANIANDTTLIGL